VPVFIMVTKRSLYCSRLIIFLLFLGIAYFSLPTNLVKARSLEIAEVKINAEILPNGDLRVVESRTVDFNGQFQGMYQEIDFFGIDLFSEIVVREGDDYYTLVEQFPTSEPGTYSIQVYDDDYFTVDWSFFALNEIRTFTLEYIARDVVVVHDDVAEFNYKFVGDRWGFPSSSAIVQLVLPDGAEPEDVRAWGHGPRHGEIDIISPSEITWWVAPLPANTFLEGRVTFPVSLVPDSTRFSGKEALPDILREEQRWAASTNALRTAHQYQVYITLLVVALAAWRMVALWRKAMNRKNAYRGDYYRELPGDYPPVATGYLWNKKKIMPDNLSAQILNLARLRHLKIEEIPGSEDYQLVETKSERTQSSLDSLVTEFIFSTVFKHFTPKKEKQNDEPVSELNKVVTFKQIQEFAKKRANQFYSFYNSWSAAAKKAGEEQVFFKKSSAFNWGCLPLVLMIVVALVAMIWWELYLLGIILIVLPFILFFASPNTYYTEYGADQLMKWRAFRKFLLHFSSMDRSTVPSLIIWEHYLVYAVVLGVAKQVIDQLAIVFPKPEIDPTFNQTSWSTFGAAHSLAAIYSMNRMTTSLNRTINGARRTASSTIAASRSSSSSRSSGGFSSGSGFGGGGFSGGGGGGFGGGGGGFR